MSKKTSRGVVSISGKTWQRFDDWCKRNGIAKATLLRELIDVALDYVDAPKTEDTPLTRKRKREAAHVRDFFTW